MADNTTLFVIIIGIITAILLPTVFFLYRRRSRKHEPSEITQEQIFAETGYEIPQNQKDDLYAAFNRQTMMMFASVLVMMFSIIFLMIVVGNGSVSLLIGEVVGVGINAPVSGSVLFLIIQAKLSTLGNEYLGYTFHQFNPKQESITRTQRVLRVIEIDLRKSIISHRLQAISVDLAKSE